MSVGDCGRATPPQSYSPSIGQLLEEGTGWPSNLDLFRLQAERQPYSFHAAPVEGSRWWTQEKAALDPGAASGFSSLDPAESETTTKSRYLEKSGTCKRSPCRDFGVPAPHPICCQLLARLTISPSADIARSQSTIGMGPLSTSLC
jgi:hypothetical protein